MCYRHIGWSCIGNGWKFGTRKSTGCCTRTWHWFLRRQRTKGMHQSFQLQSPVRYMTIQSFNVLTFLILNLASTYHGRITMEGKHISRSCIVHAIKFKRYIFPDHSNTMHSSIISFPILNFKICCRSRRQNVDLFRIAQTSWKNCRTFARAWQN